MGRTKRKGPRRRNTPERERRPSAGPVGDGEEASDTQVHLSRSEREREEERWNREREREATEVTGGETEKLECAVPRDAGTPRRAAEESGNTRPRARKVEGGAGREEGRIKKKGGPWRVGGRGNEKRNDRAAPDSAALIFNDILQRARVPLMHGHYNTPAPFLPHRAADGFSLALSSRFPPTPRRIMRRRESPRRTGNFSRFGTVSASRLARRHRRVDERGRAGKSARRSLVGIPAGYASFTIDRFAGDGREVEYRGPPR